jgi:hypothetical protein
MVATLVVAIAFGASVSLLMGLHVYLLLHNRTTIEDAGSEKLNMYALWFANAVDACVAMI